MSIVSRSVERGCECYDVKFNANEISLERTDDVDVCETRQGQVFQKLTAQSTGTHDKHFAISIQALE